MIYGWIFGIERGEREAHQGAHMRIPRFVQFMLKYVTPLYLLAIFLGVVFYKDPRTGMTQVDGYVQAYQQDVVARISILFIVAVAVFLLIMIGLAGRRWQREGRYDLIDATEQ